MDTNIFDVVAGLAMFSALSAIWIRMTWTERGSGPVIGYIASLLITLLVFILFRAVRYQLALSCIGISLAVYLFNYLTVIRPHNKRLSLRRHHYGAQLYEALKAFRIILPSMVGIKWTPDDHPEPDEIYLFIDRDNYYRHFHKQNFTRTRWEFIILNGIEADPEKSDRLFIALIAERAGTASLALPFSGGYVNSSIIESSSDRDYVWFLALACCYHGANIILYPHDEIWRKALANYDTSLAYFQEHISRQPHIVLEAPSLSDDVLRQYLRKTIVSSITTPRSAKKPELFISSHRSQGDVIQYAIALAQTASAPE